MGMKRVGELGTAAAVLLMFGMSASAQLSTPTNVKDSSVLRPPPGYKVAIVEFEDLQCPDCARAFPVVKDAVDKYKIPWAQHDFPLPFHNWSFDAAVYARYFDTKAKTMGDEFRGQVFAAQQYLHSPDDVKTFAQKFAAQHGVQLPFILDPQGKLAALVKADYALGQQVGIEHTPTIWVVTNAKTGGPPFVEVLDRSKLYQMIEAAIRDAGGVKDAAPVHAPKRTAR